MSSRNVFAVDIRPTTSVYATYSRLSYKSWFAIAEFVDNSTQSYFDHKAELQAAYEREGQSGLTVKLDYNAVDNSLTIYDNAYGMEIEDFIRALRLDSPPAVALGRSEFGMGLKTAACWFGTHWTLESSRLGSGRLLTASVDVRGLAEHHPDTVEVHEAPAPPSTHFTRITIRNLYNPLRTRTLTRIEEQLGSMYREDLRSGEVSIVWSGSPVSYEEQPILETESDGALKVWRRDVQFDVPWEDHSTTLPVKGWIGIRKTGKQRDAGFVLMRRGRVIVGGPGEGYKPEEVFGARNMFRSQRLIGELHLDDWPVTQAKDGFAWAGGLEESFIESLKEISEEFGEFADTYRAPEPERVITNADMEEASKPVKQAIEHTGLGNWIKDQVAPHPAARSKRAEPEEIQPSPEVQESSKGPIVYRLPLDAQEWMIRLHWQDQHKDQPWMQVTHYGTDQINIYLNAVHPFFAPYLEQPGTLELLQKFVLSLALAEKLSMVTAEDGKVAPTDFRVLMNRVLKYAVDVEGSTDA